MLFVLLGVLVGFALGLLEPHYGPLVFLPGFILLIIFFQLPFVAKVNSFLFKSKNPIQQILDLELEFLLADRSAKLTAAANCLAQAQGTDIAAGSGVLTSTGLLRRKNDTLGLFLGHLLDESMPDQIYRDIAKSLILDATTWLVWESAHLSVSRRSPSEVVEAMAGINPEAAKKLKGFL